MQNEQMDYIDDYEYFEPTPPKCECGAEAVGGLGEHSDWCPKYKKGGDVT